MTTEGLSAILLGATGAIGKEILSELLKNPKFSNVVVVTRRSLGLASNTKLEEKIVNFDKLDDYREAFEKAKVAFCCLGTTRGKSGVEGFIKVDRDYVVSAAKLCKEAGCHHFHLVTAIYSNAKSSTLYSKTKGEAENLVKELDFPRLSIYRPGLLICDREDSRPIEKIGQLLARGFDWRNKFSIPVENVAHAMITNTFLEQKGSVEVLEHRDINTMGID